MWVKGRKQKSGKGRTLSLRGSVGIKTKHGALVLLQPKNSAILRQWLYFPSKGLPEGGANKCLLDTNKP
jgi:hypothetical protein